MVQKATTWFLKTGRERGRGGEEKQLDGAREDDWRVISLYRLLDGISQKTGWASLRGRESGSVGKLVT